MRVSLIDKYVELLIESFDLYFWDDSFECDDLYRKLDEIWLEMTSRERAECDVRSNAALNKYREDKDAQGNSKGNSR